MNMPEGTSPLDYERSERLDQPDETWRNDDEETMRPSFDMVAYANQLLADPELHRMLRRLYADNAPRVRMPVQMELRQRQEEIA